MTKHTTPMSEGQEKKEGGSAWELSEAIKLMGEAAEAGDREQMGTAMRRHSEALTNATNEIMIPTLKSVLETVMKSGLSELGSRIENSDKARLLRNEQFQEELNERLDGHARVLDKDVKSLAASVEGAAQLAGKAVTLAGEAMVEVEALAGVVSDLGEGLNALVDRVLLVEQTPGTSPALLKGQIRLERRVMWLTVAVAAFVLLMLVVFIRVVVG